MMIFRALQMPLLIVMLIGSIAAAQDNAAEQSALSDDGELCSRLFLRTVTAYQELSRLLPKNTNLSPNLPVTPLLTMHAEDCALPETMAKIEKGLSLHSGKIALLLPFSKLPRAAGQDLIRGVQTWMQARGMSSERLLVWRDTQGTKAKMEAQLAQVVFQQHVALLIGGLQQNEAPSLSQWADRLRIPAIILNRKPEQQQSKYTFFMTPDYRQLASALSRFALSRNLQRIAILQPQFSHDEGFIAAFRSQAEHLRLQVTSLIYNPYDYTSIDGTMRKLFHIDDESRKQELLDLLTKSKETAAELGVPFDPKNLVLPPVIDVDAILIADHFKNVRHISKALAYYGVKKIQLMGIPKWRAYELIEPPDENLVGAVFVDYLGTYKQLSYGIQVPLVDREYFAEGAQAGAVDLRLVVHHAIFSSLEALAGPRSPRFALYRRLETVAGPHDGFLAGPRVFRTDHIAYWPSFLFGVGAGSISILQTWNPNGAATHAASARP